MSDPEKQALAVPEGRVRTIRGRRAAFPKAAPIETPRGTKKQISHRQTQHDDKRFLEGVERMIRAGKGHKLPPTVLSLTRENVSTPAPSTTFPAFDPADLDCLDIATMQRVRSSCFRDLRMARQEETIFRKAGDVLIRHHGVGAFHSPLHLDFRRRRHQAAETIKAASADLDTTNAILAALGYVKRTPRPKGRGPRVGHPMKPWWRRPVLDDRMTKPRHWTPPLWRDVTDAATILWWHLALKSIGPVLAGTINLDAETERLARSKPNPVGWFRARLDVELKEMFGRKVTLWLVAETHNRGALHFHAEISLPPADAEAARTCLRLAGGEWEATARCRQALTRPDPDCGWPSYCAKRLTPGNADLNGRRIAASRQVTQIAADLYGQCRRAIMEEQSPSSVSKNSTPKSSLIAYAEDREKLIDLSATEAVDVSTSSVISDLYTNNEAPGASCAAREIKLDGNPHPVELERNSSEHHHYFRRHSGIDLLGCRANNKGRAGDDNSSLLYAPNHKGHDPPFRWDVHTGSNFKLPPDHGNTIMSVVPFPKPDPLKVALTPGPIFRRQTLSALRQRAWRSGLNIKSDPDPWSDGLFRIEDRHDGTVVAGGPGYGLRLDQIERTLDGLSRAWSTARPAAPPIRLAL